MIVGVIVVWDIVRNLVVMTDGSVVFKEGEKVVGELVGLSDFMIVGVILVGNIVD